MKDFVIEKREERNKYKVERAKIRNEMKTELNESKDEEITKKETGNASPT